MGFYDEAGRLVRDVVSDEVPHGLVPAGWPAPLTALFQAPDVGGFYLARWHLGTA